MTYVTNRNASVILVPVAVYVGMGDPDDLAAGNFLLRGGRRERGGGVEEGTGGGYRARIVHGCTSCRQTV